jgi:hypothetical protein
MVTQPRNVDHAGVESMSPQPIPKNVPRKHPIPSSAAYSAHTTPSVPAASTSADARVLTYKDIMSAGLP